MNTAVTATVLGAAGLHAIWNAIAHGFRDRLATMALIQGATSLLALICLPFVPVPDAGAWPWLLSSAVVHVGYNLLLVRSYSLGDFGQVYPIARGTSPWVTTLIAVSLVGEHLTAGQYAGVAVISVGMLVLALAGGLPRRAESAALTAAFATGLGIAGYTVLDGLGVRSAGSAIGYAAWLFLLEATPTLVIIRLRRGAGLWSDVRPAAAWGALGGGLSVTSYALVIQAQTRGDLATIAALRETSVVFGAIIGAVVFRETYGRSRIVATLLVFAGIAAIHLS